MEIFARIKFSLEKKRAKTFLANVYAWHQTCEEVSEIMGAALHDQSVIKKDIGSIVDAADRMLFLLRYYIPESLGTLRRRNPELAQRFDHACQQVFVLRNNTTSFLIRSQGPGPLSGEEPDEGTRLMYYYRALEDVGFKARDLKKELDREIQFIWRDLQGIILQEQYLASYSG